SLLYSLSLHDALPIFGVFASLYFASSFNENNILHCRIIKITTSGLKNRKCRQRIVKAIAKQIYHTGGSRKCRRLKLKVLAIIKLSLTMRHPPQYQNAYHNERNTLNKNNDNSIFGRT